jgi:hypothetical protein
VTEAERPRFFFIHVMKTGGTTLVFQMLENFEPDEFYPGEIDRSSTTDAVPYASIPKMQALSPERRARIRLYTGHLPYVASELLGLDVVRLTMLRDPIDRTISMLKHVKRLFEGYSALSLEEIYDDEAVFRRQIDNYQTKVFALSAEEREGVLAMSRANADASTGVDPIPPLPERSGGPRPVVIAEHRFARAKSNLANVDVIGLSERYGDFIEELRARFGWWPDGVRQRGLANVSSEDWGVSPELRRRIADDLAVDMEFYEYAKELVEARRKSS